jgi:hypothetical protein
VLTAVIFQVAVFCVVTPCSLVGGYQCRGICRFIFRVVLYISRDRLGYGKGKIVLVLNLAPRHEGVWERRGIAPLFLISVLDGNEW